MKGSEGRGVLAAVLALAGLCAAVALAGCGQLAELRRERLEDRTLGEISHRMTALQRVEGRGVVMLEYRDQTVELPFALRLDGEGVLDLEAEVPAGLWLELGSIRVVSDVRDTRVYAAGSPVEIAELDTLGYLLRPFLLSAFGGGDLLVHWLVASGCNPGREARCAGLEITLKPDAKRSSVAKWTIRDRGRGASFTGFVYAWRDEGPFPRIVAGMIHPYEIGVTVQYDEIGLAGTDPRPGRPAPPGSQAPRWRWVP
ncbi:MAG: hypothetical protein WAW06_00425 [bacterium]